MFEGIKLGVVAFVLSLVVFNLLDGAALIDLQKQELLLSIEVLELELANYK